MAGEYKKQNLTIIIPTLGKNIDGIKQLIRAVKQESSQVKIIVVWDNINNIPKILNDIFQKLSIELIIHGKNRGLSAARNSGVTNCQTQLGMFIDDDILPKPGLILNVIAFHNENIATNDMLIGKVTWQGGKEESTLTNWYECRGNWTALTNSQHMQKMSNFMGGFTSFKLAAFQALTFDESFNKYGCEDTEFGYRFFSQGGQLYFIDGIVGIHEKALSVDVYCRQHIAAGYSKALLTTKHPDLAFKIDYFYQAVNLNRSPISLEQIQNQVSLLLNNQNNADAISSIFDVNMSFLTELSMAKGFIEYFKDHCPHFRESFLQWPEFPSKESFIRKATRVKDIPYFLFIKAMSETDTHLKIQLLKLCASQQENYAAPLIELVHIDREEWLPSLRAFLLKREAYLDLTTKNMIKQIISNHSTVDFSSMSARDKYLYMMKEEDNLSILEMTSICQTIICLDVTFVSAYIMLAKIALKGKTMEVARMNLNLAEYFSKRRPLSERLQHEGNISALTTELDK